MAIETSEESRFLGAGIAFPLGVDADGNLAMNGLEEHVRQSIRLIMRTSRGERVMHPEFGVGLDRFVFEPLTATTVAMVQHEVKDGLARFEPRIDVLKVDVTLDLRDGKLEISVDFRVRRTDTLLNVVYPFYLDRGEL